MDEGAKSTELIQVTWGNHRSEWHCLDGDNRKRSRTATTDINDHYQEHICLALDSGPGGSHDGDRETQ